MSAKIKTGKVRNSDGQLYWLNGEPALSFGSSCSPTQIALSLAWQTKLPDELIVKAAALQWGEQSAAKFLAIVHEYRGQAVATFTR